MIIIRVGVDIAKSIFHIHGVGRHDQALWTCNFSPEMAGCFMQASNRWGRNWH